MEDIYRTKYPLKQIFFASILILVIILYIFWGLLHVAIILGIAALSIFLISSTLTPIFILKDDKLIRSYPSRPFAINYIYPIHSIDKIEVKQNRQGYQAFPTMKIFFLQNSKAKKHLFYFIKDNQKDFDNLFKKMKEQGIDVKFLMGN